MFVSFEYRAFLSWMPACIRATGLLPPCLRTSDSCFSNSGCKHHQTFQLHFNLHSKHMLTDNYIINLLMFKTIWHKLIHTKFCCDAWSRNCCAVSNSVLSNSTSIKCTICRTMSTLINCEVLSRVHWNDVYAFTSLCLLATSLPNTAVICCTTWPPNL